MSGTITNPIKFEKVINSNRVIAGDVLLLRGGTYKGDWLLNIGGTAEAPVTIKPYDREPVVIDGSITFGKPFVRVVDCEITNSNPNRSFEGKSITMNQRGCELVGCDIHDLHSSGVNWFGPAGRVAECWIHGNGYYTDGIGHGHAIYSHNHQGGEHLIEHNLLTRQVGRYSIHVYSGGENWLQDFTCRANVIDNHPVHIGGGLGVKNLLYENNIQYGDYAQIGRYSPVNYNATIRDNLFIGVGGYTVEPFQSLTEENNIAWDCTWTRDGYKADVMPANWSKFTPFTLSQRWSGIQVTLDRGVFSAAMVAK